MPDWWESAYGFDPLNSADGSADSDSDGIKNFGEYIIGTDPTMADTDADGMTDYMEQIAGTDPNDPSDTFTISAGLDAARNNTVSWQGAAGRWYTAQTNQDLITAGWGDIPGFVKVPGNGAPISFTNTSSESSIYYRILVTDQP